MRLVPEPHRTFLREAASPNYETLDFTPAHTTTNFDPTADILPSPQDSPTGQQAQQQAIAYFNSRPITHLEATGADSSSDLTITLQIALDPEASLLFTFLVVSD